MPQIVPRAKATLQLQILDATGKIVKVEGATLPDANIVLHVGAPDSVVIPFELPADAGAAKTMRVMLVLDGFGPDAQIYVDDIGIYRLD